MSARGDAISDNDAKDPASRPVAPPAGLRWGEVDVPAPPGDRPSSGGGERDVKGVFGVPKPPPPAGASLAGTPNTDPLASLFAVDTIVKAPGIHDAPSEAELGRWRATMQSSLFEERVVDPAPRVSVPVAPVALDLAEEAAPAPAVAPPPAPPPARAPVRESPSRELAEALPRPPEPAPEEPELPAERSRSTKSTGKRRRAAAEARVAEAAAEVAPAPAARRRRVERGPSKGLLAALGIAAVSAVAALVIVLGPSGDASVEAPPAPAPRAAAPTAAAPVATPTAPTAPSAPTAAVPVAVTAKSVPAPAAPAPSNAAPAPVAARGTAAPAPVAAPAPAAAPAKAAAPAPSAAPKPEASDDDSEAAPEALLHAGRQALSADDAPGAERIARQALAQAPQDHHAMELLVLALMDQDRGTDALPFARRMVQKRSRRVPYRLLLGDLLLMVGDEPGARREWQQALALSPADNAIKRRLGL